MTTRRRNAWIPAIDIATTPDHLIVTMDLAGTAKEDITVTYSQPTLTISGERHPIDGHTHELTYHTRERGWSHFRRDITLPVEIDQENLAIALNNGVLTITACRHRPSPRKSQPPIEKRA